jgi:glycosyltransferase involved in cell wall biosynthesis
MVSSSTTHIGLLNMDQWLGGSIYIQNLIKALRRLPADEAPGITLFYRRDTSPSPEISALVDDVVEFHSRLDKTFSNTRFASKARKIDYYASTLLFRDSAPSLGYVAKRLHVDAMFPVQDLHAHLTPNPIAWIPDLQHCVLPQFFTTLNRKVRENRFSRLLANPHRHVIFSSSYTLNQATRVYGAPKAKTHVLHFATVPMPEWFGDPASVVANYSLDLPYFIVCNQFWAHKDHITLFKAIAILKQQGLRINLVCTRPSRDPSQSGAFESLQSQVKILGIESQVRILGTIPRNDQIALIRASEAICQPSQFEGWSTVIEDARALGKPVIASDFPVHIEQNAPGSFFFRMGDPKDCARTIARFPQKPDTPLYSQSRHDVHVLEFANNFLDIVHQLCPAKTRRKVTAPVYSIEEGRRRESA